MKKCFLLCLSLSIFIGFFTAASAEKTPVRLTMAQVVSTVHDETQIGDWIDFRVVNDVYIGNDLYIKNGTPVIGIVDFVHENGFIHDNAEISMKKFMLSNINSNKVEFCYPFVTTQMLVTKNNVKEETIRTILAVIRGSEIYIEPDTLVFTVFIASEVQAKKQANTEQ